MARGKLSVDAPRAWMPRQAWDALVRGEECPLCATVVATEVSDPYGYTVADLEVSRLRLAANQFVPGYCVLIYKQHVREPYQLPVAERQRYFEDMMRAARALDQVFTPVKMNFQLLGNAVPHLHCHLVPRFYGDPAPSRPLDPNLETVLLTPHGYEERAAAIRAALV